MIEAMRSFGGWWAALCSDKRGGTMIMAAFMLLAICGVAGLGVDVATWYTNQRQMQRIVEAAALAAAPLLSTTTNTSAIITAVAENDAVLDGLSTAKGDSISVQIANDRSSVTVTATRNLQRNFSLLFMSANPTTTVAATAGPGGTPVCILVLDPSASQSLLVNSGANLNAPNCEIDVASTSGSAAMIDSSLPDIAKMCVAGGSTVNGGAQVNNLTDGCTVASDPFAGTIPAPSYSGCTVSNQNYSGTVNLSPGTYCGTFNFNGSGTAKLSAGTYIFKGTHWNLNSGWTISGTGVTFYFVDSSSYIQINSGVATNLSAPTSGTYANVLMFEPAGLSASSFAVDGSSSGHLLQGLIYLPSRNITFNSTSNVTSDGLTLVANTVIFDSLNWSISPAPNAIPSASGSTSAVLLQ
jgi:Flp pilus assembly protein TadG